MKMYELCLMFSILIYSCNNLIAQNKRGVTIGLQQYDIPKDIDVNLVEELNVNYSQYASLFVDLDFRIPIDSSSAIRYHIGYAQTFLGFGPLSLADAIGTTVSGNLDLQYQRNAADYRLHYLTVGANYEYFFKERDKGFSVSGGPKLFYQIHNKHRRARLLDNKEVIALPIVDKQSGLNKFAAHIDLSIAYNISIKSYHFAIGFQNSIRVRSFYTDIPIGNRYFNRGLFIGFHF